MIENQRNQPLWAEEAELDLPALTGTVRADVCVVGLGGSGLAAIHALLEAGATVVGVDARGVAAGAAGRNGGFLLAGLAGFHHTAVRRYGRESAVRFYRWTLEQIARMERETPNAVRRTGSLRIASSVEEERDCREQLSAMGADGLSAEWYEGVEGRGLLTTPDAVYHPVRRCHQLAHQALRRGARLYAESPVTTVARGEARTDAGRVHCQAILVAVDGGLATILPELGPRLRSARLQMLATAPTSVVHFRRPVYTRWGYDYWQQLPDGRLVFGGFRDRFEAEEWTASPTPTPMVQRAMELFVRERLGVAAPITHRWAALVSFTDTGLPILEEVRPAVLAVGAYSGTGNVVGPLCARAAARLALGDDAPVAVELQRMAAIASTVHPQV